MLKKNIEEMFHRFEARDPEPEGELDYLNVYTLLVAVVLSAQATDVGVNKATKKLFQIADTPEKMVSLGLDGITEHVRTIGLYRNKAKNILSLSHRLIDVFNSQVPENRDDLESLAGVGRKTANVVLNLFFGHPTIAVDTHIFRLSNRLKLAPSKNVVETERKLEKIIPAKYKRHSHHWLILHGRYVCKARKPLCNDCIIVDLCKSKDKVI